MYSLEKDGSDMGNLKFTGDEAADAELTEIRGMIQTALLKRNAETLASVTYAASEGDLDAVRTLLKRGLEIDSGDYDGRTTLHLAAVEGNIRVVECLVAEGASVNVKDRWGQTPLQEAVRHNHTQVISFLAKSGAQLMYEDPSTQLCTCVFPPRRSRPPALASITFPCCIIVDTSVAADAPVRLPCPPAPRARTTAT